MFVCNILLAVGKHLAMSILQISQVKHLSFLSKKWELHCETVNRFCGETSWYQGRII